VTCFIADLDITGGNSGSPTLDAKGNIIGIAFDGNWEAMSGDIAYEPALQRTIVVDIRYVLFIVEELMGGKNIIEELKFVNGK
jgi:S1-C subfamily serine protease